MSNNKIPDLKVNGRIFPLWILKTFKEYKLEKIIEEGDICNKETKNSDLELYKY